MSTTSSENAGSQVSDLWIAAGVVFCLALGASVTYWLTGGAPPNRVGSAPAKEIKGELINSKTKPVASKTETKAAPAEPAAEGEHLQVSFDLLGSFFYEIPNPDDLNLIKKPENQIPAPITELNNKKIAVKGFMVPIKLEKGATKSFLLVKDQSLCCFGRMPRMNEWISVRMEGEKTTKFVNDQPVTVFGTIHVGEEVQDGEVLSIFRMEAEDVAGPLDL